MWIFIILLLSGSIVPSVALLFPWKDAYSNSFGIIHLHRGETYLIEHPVVWQNLSKVVINGNGAILKPVGNWNSAAAAFTLINGSSWLWENVNLEIRDRNLSKVLEMQHCHGSLLQVRNCLWTTNTMSIFKFSGSGEVDMILENNVWTSSNKNTTFIATQISASNVTTLIFTWIQNRWSQNFDLSFFPVGVKVNKFERNAWPLENKNIHTSWLKYGSFYSKDGSYLCVPPSMYQSSMGSLYRACLVEWMIESVRYFPGANIMFTPAIPYMLPDPWTIAGNVSVDFTGNSLTLSSIIVSANSSVVLSYFSAAWPSFIPLQVIVLFNSTFEVVRMESSNVTRTLNFDCTTSSSNVFIIESDLTAFNVLATGLGHLHIQKSNMEDFLVTAPTMWASENRFVSGRIVTQPYAGHVLDSFLQETEYTISPFYLGKEPRHRLRFMDNTWAHGSDINIAEGMSIHGKPISFYNEIVEDKQLYRKLSFSAMILTHNTIISSDGTGLLGTAPKDTHIWPKHASAFRCPDGTTPGGPKDQHGISTMCMRCAVPYRSKGGKCDNVREVDLLLDKFVERKGIIPKGPGFGETTIVGARFLLVSPEQALYDTSYLNYISSSEMRTNCYTCAALCLGIPTDQLDTYQFTLPQLLEPDNKPADSSTTCTKCALYCSDLSGCSAMATPFEVQLLVVFLAMLGISVPATIAYLVCFRSPTVFYRDVTYKDKIRCPYCGNLNPANSRFCNQCRTVLSRVTDLDGSTTDNSYIPQELINNAIYNINSSSTTKPHKQ